MLKLLWHYTQILISTCNYRENKNMILQRKKAHLKFIRYMSYESYKNEFHHNQIQIHKLFCYTPPSLGKRLHKV